MTTNAAGPKPFRFFDNREKYLLFVSTCSEKRVTAQRIGEELRHLAPRPPAFRLFDAGMGDATVLGIVLRAMHDRWPSVPFLVVGKETNYENLRHCFDKLGDRFHEHPQMVVAVTNLFYSEAPRLRPRRPAPQAELNWHAVALEGGSAHRFDAQIRDQLDFVRHAWITRPHPESGNPLYVTPSVVLFYRADQAFVLDGVIPRQGHTEDLAYDLVIVSQPYRSRLAAELKVRNVLAPLVGALAPGGRMITIQSTGRDPGMEIIHHVWPDENPFRTPRNVLIEELSRQLGARRSEVYMPRDPVHRAEFSYELELSPDELAGSIGTSPILAAWNAATYVAQIEDAQLRAALEQGSYLDATRKVLAEHGGLWFTNEAFVVVRKGR
ncbi:MAG: hypothetical protein EXQ94_13170 [Alphaproteobacteria bacterium]|nr:hypothetical protein [Alphaproteobacteria bacterium]